MPDTPQPLPDLDELEALATPGKWSAVPSINEPERLTVQTETVPLRRDDANRNTLFVVALHNAFPALIAEVKRLRKAASLLKAADLVCEKARDYEFLLLDENATDEAAAFEVMVVGRHLKAIYDANHVYQQVKAAALTEGGE